MFKLKTDHVSLLLPGEFGGGSTGRRSLKRSWKQLSRFQRNLILTVVLAVGLTCVVVISNSGNKEETGNNAAENPAQQHIKISGLRTDEIDSLLAKPDTTDHIRIDPQVVEPQSEEKEQQFEKEVAKNEVIENVIAEVQTSEKLSKVVAEEEVVPMTFKGPTNSRQEAVVEAFNHAWKGYKKHAWGHDNFKPLSGGSSDWFGLGLTLVDALDTMYIMNLKEEFDEARNWVSSELKFENTGDVNLFEVTIRVLGGLLSAYHLSGDKMFLNKSIDLGNRLMPSFDSPSGIPFSDVNLKTLKSHAPKWSPDSSTSEVTTIQLEFRDLSRCSGIDTFEIAVQRVSEKVHNLPKKSGLVPIFINANSGNFRTYSTISLGARADSYYEYLLKQWLQTGKKENDYLIQDYQTAIEGVLNLLVKKTAREGHIYIGELIGGKEFKPKMDHLTCYLPGTLLLGYKHGMPESHLTLAKDLLETCYQTYMRQPTQLAPEITYFNLVSESEQDMYVKTNDAHNLLRPEFIESLYYFYALTGNQTYQEMGWIIFNAFEKYTRVAAGGYTSIGNVKNALNTRPRDMMESFFLGETLKYFYLLFSDNRSEIDLDKFVFNSEAHPLPVRTF